MPDLLPELLPNPSDVAAIVLAAGASRRFGTDKLLHPLTLHGLTLPLAAHSLLPWVEAFSQITVIVKPAADNFCRTIEASLGTSNATKVRWLVCADADNGLASSLICGVQANARASGWLIGLADMPAVPAVVIASVRNALLNDAKLAAPFCKEKRGHPVGFSAHYLNELLSLSGDTGAKHLLERDQNKIVQIAIEDAGILTDIDTTADLDSL